MKFSFSFESLAKYVPKPALRGVVNLSWWLVLILFLTLLLSDSFLFYLYGLGYISKSDSVAPMSVTTLHEATIQKAMGIIQNSAARFNADLVIPSNLNNPFK